MIRLGSIGFSAVINLSGWGFRQAGLTVNGLQVDCSALRCVASVADERSSRSASRTTRKVLSPRAYICCNCRRTKCH